MYQDKSVGEESSIVFLISMIYFNISTLNNEVVKNTKSLYQVVYQDC